MASTPFMMKASPWLSSVSRPGILFSSCSERMNCRLLRSETFFSAFSIQIGMRESSKVF